VGESYVGTVSEGGGRVEVEPPIRADNGPICGYRLLATHTPNIPFEVSPKWVQVVGVGGGGAPHQSGQRPHLWI
jgi:hypothetical protein